MKTIEYIPTVSQIESRVQAGMTTLADVRWLIKQHKHMVGLLRVVVEDAKSGLRPTVGRIIDIEHVLTEATA